MFFCRPFLVLLLTTFGYAATVSPVDWALALNFPATPEQDEQRTPSPYGDEVASRYFSNHEGTVCMAVKFTYPMATLQDSKSALYENTLQSLVRARPGIVIDQASFSLGSYSGHRLRLFYKTSNISREARVVLIGGSLYLLNAEWPGEGEPPSAIADFIRNPTLQPGFEDARLSEENGRWRTITLGQFAVRYDASRWYRDPNSNEKNLCYLLRVDQQAEAEFRVEAEPPPTTTVGEHVLANARETASSIKVLNQGKKYCGTKLVENLEFAVQTGTARFVNHGYFYRSPKGTVYLRAWADEGAYAQISGDIAELLSGLKVLP